MFGILIAMALMKLVVLPTRDAIVADDGAALASAMRSNLGTLGLIISVFALIMGAFVPGWLRQRSARRSLGWDSGALVYTGRLSGPLKRELRRFVLGIEEVPRGISFTFSATSRGVQLWTGILRPHLLMDIPWSEVNEFSTGFIDDHGRVMSTVCMDVEIDGVTSVFAFAVGSERLLGLLPSGEGEIEHIVNDLNAIRLSRV
jgi:hypothetical protein